MKGILKVMLLMAVVTVIVGCTTYRFGTITQEGLVGSPALDATPVYIGALSFSERWDLRVHADAELSPFLKKAIIEKGINARFVETKDKAVISVDPVSIGFNAWNRVTTLIIKVNNRIMTVKSTQETTNPTLGTRAWQFKVPIQSACALAAIGVGGGEKELIMEEPKASPMEPA